jgi:FemAB-related protein (PEP-CTERM system-associated)
MIVALNRPVASWDPGDVTVDIATSGGAWDAHVASRPDATIYHRWTWKRIFEVAFGKRARYLLAKRDGAVVGLLPLVAFESNVFGRFAVSLPFVNYGGILADDADVQRALIDAGLRWAHAERLKYLELRHVNEPRSPEWPSRRHKVSMQLPLAADAEDQWTRFDRKVRNQVRKAEKNGLTVEIGAASLLADFYAVFARNMRDLGTPVYPREFFDLIVRHLPDASRVFVVRLGTRPVAASMTLADRGVMEVPWASSLRDTNELAPNMLLYWVMLRTAIADGCRRFDFGRSTPGAGTYRFKEQWGARPVQLVWEYAGLSGPLPDVSPANPKFQAAIAIWRRLPLAVTTRLGPRLVRNIP